MFDQNFTIYPAIDIRDGKCVRLFKGDYEQETVYNNDPVAVALRWAEFGAKFLHIIDLDGAKEGRSVNLEIVKKIQSETKLPIQLGGGIRDYETAKSLLESGIERVILGSSVLKNPDFVKRALTEFGEHVVVGMDCRGGNLAVEGWLEDSDASAIDVALDLKSHGLKTVIYTDIHKDGTLEGPNIAEISSFARETELSVIASGGVSCIDDVHELQGMQAFGMQVDGVIIGKALYAGSIDPIELFRKPNISELL